MKIKFSFYGTLSRYYVYSVRTSCGHPKGNKVLVYNILNNIRELYDEA